MAEDISQVMSGDSILYSGKMISSLTKCSYIVDGDSDFSSIVFEMIGKSLVFG